MNRVRLIVLAVLAMGLPGLGNSGLVRASGSPQPVTPPAAGSHAAPRTPLPNSWTQVGPVLPPAGSVITDRPALAYDGSRMLLFTNDDTWAWDGSHWRALCAAAVAGVAGCAVPPREQEGVAYDAANGTLVLAGGVSDHSFTDTWTFDGTTWTAACGTTTPSTPACAFGTRYSAAMAHDPVSKRVIMFGGWSDTVVNPTAETWAWDGSSWTAVCGTTTPATSLCGPAARQAASLAFDPASQTLILFGGDAATDTWSFDGSTNKWTQLQPQTSPPARSDAGLSSDGQHLLLFGGDGACGSFCSDTWLWNGTAGNWSQVTPAASPPARFSPSLAYDSGHQQVVLFGGAAPNGSSSGSSDWLNDTWLWDGQNWSEPPQTVAPSPRETVLAYDAQHQQVVLFGGGEQTGNGLETLADTWTWDGSTWTPRCGTLAPVTPACGPSNRDVASLAYDPALQEVVLFGGSCETSCASTLADMWAWNGSDWTAICGTAAPPTSCGPPARSYASMAYDGHQLILFGGQTCPDQSCDNPTTLGDTWTWDGTTWTPVCGTTIAGATSLCGPAPRVFADMAFDAGHGQAVLFGGASTSTSASVTLFGDTWLWTAAASGSGGSWSPACSTCGPEARVSAAMTYDAGAGNVVLFGGLNVSNGGGAIFNDTWTWDGKAWTQQCTSSPCDSTLPPTRFFTSMAYDAAAGNSVLYGGIGGSCCLPQSLTDTWVWTGGLACKTGDVNCNGTVDATDALCVLRLVASLPSTGACPVPEPNPTKIATDGNPKLDATDALCILRAVAHLGATNACPAFPAPIADSSGVGSREPGVGSRAGATTSSSAPASAAEARVAVRLQPAEADALPGRQTTVTLTLDASRLTPHASRPLGAWTIDIGYDPTQLKVVDCQAASGGLCNPSYGAGVVRVVGASVSGLTGTRTLASITFEGVGHGNKPSPLTLTAVALAGTNGEPLTASTDTTAPSGTPTAIGTPAPRPTRAER
jgi:hypothetical protein